MNKKKVFKLLFGTIFLAFLISYVISLSGYYEYNLRNKSIMTKEAMERFEDDLEKGKDVRMEDYVVNTTRNYTSRLTTGTNRVSVSFNAFLKRGIEEVFRVASRLVED